MVAWTGIYRPVVPVLNNLLAQYPGYGITDLCSGNAGPMIYLAQYLEQPTILQLTDKYPSRNLLLPHDTVHQFEIKPESYDVLELRCAAAQLYCMFNAFHHFDHAEQQSILARFAQAEAPFLVVEILRPTLFEALKIALAATLGQLFTAPFIRPFSWERLFFTYVFPINLFTVCWDGIVSVAKSKPLDAYRQLAADCPTPPQYAIRAYTLRTSFLTTLTVIQGGRMNVIQP